LSKGVLVLYYNLAGMKDVLPSGKKTKISIK